MRGERRLRAVEDADPIWLLWAQLPPEWRGPVIGDGIDNWLDISENEGHRLILTGLPDVIAAEMAWMAHWQVQDGTRASVLGLNQLAHILRRAIQERHPFPSSIRAMDWPTAEALQGWYYTKRWRRLPGPDVRRRLRIPFGFARTALLARCHDGHWWEMDEWHPRCDPRIPLSKREPVGNYGCSPGLITAPWLRAATKWHLGTMLESGALRWTTVAMERLACLRRFDRWLTTCLDDPREILGDPATARQQAAAFARWAADSHNRALRDSDTRHVGKPVHPRLVNDELRAVAELFAFVAANPVDARTVLGVGPWQQVTDTHAASWFRQVTRIPHTKDFNEANYVDDHALAQIIAALPVLGLPKDEQMLITRGDGRQVSVYGLDDPQAMRMILLQILTGRRASEIRTCDADCIEPVTEATISAIADGEQLARFRYAQSKIDIAPDSILVNEEVVAIVEEQRRWVRDRFPDLSPRLLFVRLLGNRLGDKAYPPGTYNWRLREFSELAQITDSKGRPVRLSHTHRFRHTKLTRLAELGLPIHVLQRYAGHATPTMTMHYIAQREEHAELAFLATVKLRADGTRVQFSREDHDSLHLFDRADRFLPHGWCLLPPTQTCAKGNACLTCSVFVTDVTHRSTLERQLADTEQLIARTTAAFEQRHGQPMPDDNVWLAQRRAEQVALTQLLSTMDANPGRALQGAGCGAAPAGPVPITLDTRRARRTRP
jgi:Phage integrase family